MRPAVLDFYRVDQSRRIRRVLVTGATILTFGAVVIGGAFLTHQTEAIRRAAAYVGLTCTMMGAVFTAIAMQRILAEDAYVALRTDGVLVKEGGIESLVAWDELERVSFDHGRAVLVLEAKDGPAVTFTRPVAGTDGPGLVKKIDDARRKNLFFAG